MNISNTPVCTLQFSIPNDINPPVYLYYRLTNFYQNHRRYVRSLDTSQLKGSANDNSTIDGSSCDPLQLRDGKAIYPCGLIANSIFNDTINSPVFTSEAGGEDPSVYSMTNRSIAWGSDSALYRKTEYNPNDVAPPPNWARRFPDGYTEDTLPDISEYEEFQVWMRTAGLPTFSKLALRNDDDVLRAGTYQISIFDYFPVSEYDGTKSILLSTRTVVGGKNSFMGIAYVAVAGICVVIGVVFTFAHLIKPRLVLFSSGLSLKLTITDDSAITHTSRGTTSIFRPPLPRPVERIDLRAPDLGATRQCIDDLLSRREAFYWCFGLFSQYTVSLACAQLDMYKNCGFEKHGLRRGRQQLPARLVFDGIIKARRCGILPLLLPGLCIESDLPRIPTLSWISHCCLAPQGVISLPPQDQHGDFAQPTSSAASLSHACRAHRPSLSADCPVLSCAKSSAICVS